MVIADISYHQGTIYWSKARNELDFVIFRASICLDADIRYLDYARNCGLPFGVYHYVKAGTAQDARQEARVFVECANKAPRRPTIYFADIEFETQTKATTEAVCVAFLDELRNLGCKRVGLYIGQTKYAWAGAAIGMCDAIWIPRYGKNTGEIPPEQYYPKYPCDLWQYTSKGRIAGVDGNIDLNVLWGDKPLEWFTGASEEKGDSNVSIYVMTAAEIVKRAIDVAKNYKTIYMYAAFGFQVTTSTIASKAQQNLNQWYTSARIATLKAVANQTPPTWGFDCVNLYKALLWGWVGDTSKERGGAVYASNGVPDINANGMFDLCEDKSSDFSKIEPGEALWISGHFGMYIGNGLAIECTPKWKNGVQITAVLNIGSKSGYNGRKWTKHGKLPFIDYGTAAGEQAIIHKLGDRTLNKGDTGDDVAELQNALVKLGYDLGSYGVNKDGVDGDFGSKTLAAVKKVQSIAGIEQTGTFEKTTYDALMLMLASPIINPDSEAPAEADTPSDPLVPVNPANDENPGKDEAPSHVLIIQGDAETLRKLMLAYGGTLAMIDSVKVV